MNLSFAGCGFLGMYHIGAASCFLEYMPQVYANKIAGASIGSIVAAGLLTGVPIEQIATQILRVGIKTRARPMGLLHPFFDLDEILRECLKDVLPENAHITCSGRLFISCTQLSQAKNVLVSQYNSRQELIQALCCSCFIPFCSGLKFSKFNDVWLLDGGLSNNLPVLDNNTITISPFAGKHHVCPPEDKFNMLQISIANTNVSISPGNMNRFKQILCPPHPKTVLQVCQQGYNDVLRFLKRTGLVACARCIPRQPTLAPTIHKTKKRKSKIVHEEENKPVECNDCISKQAKAATDGLPEAVIKAINDACDQANKGVVNWLCQHPPLNLLLTLITPYVLSIDISIMMLCKFWKKIAALWKKIHEKIKSNLEQTVDSLLQNELTEVVHNAKSPSTLAINC